MFTARPKIRHSYRRNAPRHAPCPQCGARGNRKDVWYSADGVNWYEVPNTPWPPRHAASVFVHENALWMVAGNNMMSDVWKLQRRLPPKP